MKHNFTHHFAQRLATAAETSSRFCLGIDPSPKLMNSWGLEYNPTGLYDFCKIVLSACVGSVSIIKPQVAYFEALGWEGLKVLKDFIADARSLGIIVIADAKRADISSTLQAYANSWLGSASPFNADALTTTPWFGMNSLQDLFTHAKNHNCGVFVVVRSSNPEASVIQSAMAQNNLLVNEIAQDIEIINRQYLQIDSAGDDNYNNLWNEGIRGDIGMVVGATQGSEADDTARLAPSSLLLTPGIGAQGGSIANLSNIFSQQLLKNLIPTAARSILSCGPSVDTLKKSIITHRDQTIRLTEK